eukprot:403355075
MSQQTKQSSSSSQDKKLRATKETVTVQKVIDREIQRYQRRGKTGIILAFIQIAFLLWIVPQMGQIFWPKLLDLMKIYNLEKWQISFINSFGWSAISYFLYNFIFWIIYHLELPFFEQFKIYDGDWPWKEDPQAWRELLIKSFKLVGFNNFVVIPVALYIITLKDNYQIKYSFEIEDLPNSFTLAWQMFFCMIVQDFFFFLSHWFLHKPYFYKRIHKIHHQYNQTVGFSAEYAHPFEFLFGNVVPFIIPCLILGSRLHYFTYFIWGSFRIANTVYVHSGYDFPWVPNDICIFYGNSTYHDYHHSHNVGNFGGMITLWDTIIGTNGSFFKYIEEKDRQKKQKGQ